MKRLAPAAFCVFATVVAAQAGTLRVDSAADAGRGSLREAIAAANAAPGSTIEIVLGADAEIVVESSLPPLQARGLTLRGGGVTIREGEGCERPGGRAGCDGLVVTGGGITLRDLRMVGFTFDGVAVRGRGARDVLVRDLQAIDNLDDGVGVSAGAGPVTVEGCLLMGNGFRTKGKGLLVFDRAAATLRDSLVVANRDGVTVTRGSKAVLERVMIAGNYDKGFGVSAARATGLALQVLDNGYDPMSEKPAPNGDGVRVGLAGSVELTDSRIAGNGDSGVVVLDTSGAELRGGAVELNRGEDLVVSPKARLTRR
ncbi:MAG: hypothetical protein ABR538_16615 [Candidatus Binatia bacterium]